jgi:hypothetical protein
LLVNGTAVIPTFQGDFDDEQAALDAYRRALPADWRLRTVDGSGTIGLGGSVHCATLELRLKRGHRELGQ